MKYIVCSDIHGDRQALIALERIKEEEGADKILCAGDFCPSGDMEDLATDFLTVLGNCDRYYYFDKMIPRMNLELDFLGRKIIITHGDRYSAEDFPLSSGDIFISGHTHIPLLKKNSKGVMLLNPGSPSRPRTKEGPTYAIIKEDGIALLSFSSSAVLKKLSFKL